MRNKKGNIDIIVPAIMMILIAGFVLIMGLIMLDELMLDTADTSVTVANETLTTVTHTGESVTGSARCGFNSFQVLVVINSTTSEVIAPGNYTISRPRTGTIVPSSTVSSEYNGTSWNVTYSYKYGASDACYGANSTIAGVGGFGDYVDLLVLGIILSVILTAVLWAFSKGRVR